MAYIHLRERKEYEDRYDRQTVWFGRWNQKYFDEFFKKIVEEFGKEEVESKRFIIPLNTTYIAMVGDNLLERYDNRESKINEWMAEDEAKDQRISEARLTEEPLCQHCGKSGMRIKDKTLMHRGEHYDLHRSEDILFMLHCPSCDKNCSYWENGSARERRTTKCPKCDAIMVEKGSFKNDILTTNYSCPECKHSYREETDFTHKEEPVDPNYEEDRRNYCLLDTKQRDELRGAKRRMDGLREVMGKVQERENNKAIYDAVKEMKKPKIAELVDILSPVLEMAGYSEFTLDKPEMGRNVVIGFNCLDTKSERDDYTSQKELKKVINKALFNTNWRLMSEGIHYRLGYLNGRIRAYEGEEDLVKLVSKDKKIKYKASEICAEEAEFNSKNMRGPNGEVIRF